MKASDGKRYIDDDEVVRDGKPLPPVGENVVPMPIRPGGKQRQADDFEPFVPLDHRDPAPFPVHAMPDWLRRWIEAEAAAMQAPADFFGTLSIGVVAGALGGRVRVQVNPTRSEPTNLYAVIVADPASGKSPAFRIATAPIFEFEARKRERMADEIREAGVKRRILEQQLAQAEKEAARRTPGTIEAREAVEAVQQLARDLAEHVVPARPTVFTSDVTPEALITGLCEQGSRLIAMNAEGKEVIEAAAGRRHRGNGASDNLSALLGAHSGDDARVTRRSREEETLRNPALTLILAAQPSTIELLAGNRDDRGRGLPARFLYSTPASMVGYRKHLSEVPSMDAALREEYGRRVLNIFELYDESEVALELSPDARRAWQDYHHREEARMRPAGDRSWMADWNGKLAGHVLRLAGILHVAGDPEGAADRQIDGDTMARAIELGGYFSDHAAIAFGVLASQDPDHGLAQRLAAAIERHALGVEQPFRQSELHQRVKTSGGAVKSRDLDEPLALLVEHGYVREAPRPPTGPSGGNPGSPLFLTSPAFRAAWGRRRGS